MLQFFLEILIHEGHPNCIIGSKVTAYFLNGRILSIGGTSAGKDLCLQPAQQACLTPKISHLTSFLSKVL